VAAAEGPGDDPFQVFSEWFQSAVAGGQPEPEAMAVATATPDGYPSVRFVLLRGFDRRGLVFYTNRASRKGEELRANPRAAVAFRWYAVDRQVRVSGPVHEVDDAESDAYFAGRVRGSQLGAWASEQSRPVDSRAELDRRLADVLDRFADAPVPRPPWWGGYRIEPDQFEFWQQGSFRLHDRFRYRADASGAWRRDRLAP
jgi:pyridoxamine 5'-phosphate oxidase